MWTCPKCHSKVDDDFEVCWSCGTTPDGIEDPDFVTADDADPIENPPRDLDPGQEALLADEFGGTPMTELVPCFMAGNTIEAKFVADRLVEHGIPALADNHDINLVIGGFRPEMWGYGPCVRVRPKDLPHAQNWIKEYEATRKARDTKTDEDHDQG